MSIWQDFAHVIVFHAVFAFFALRRIWRARDETMVVRIFWAVITLVLPVIGPIMALGFVQIQGKHGEAIPPIRMGGGGSGWTGGIR